MDYDISELQSQGYLQANTDQKRIINSVISASILKVEAFSSSTVLGALGKHCREPNFGIALAVASSGIASA